MDNFSLWTNLLIVFLITNILFHLIYLIDRRTRSEGILFLQAPSLKSRIYAVLLGIILGIAFVMFWFTKSHISEQTIILAIASISLFGYGLGIDKPLQTIQKSYSDMFHAFIRSKTIVGVEGKTIEEIILKVKNGGKFVVFEYCISPFIVTLDYESNIHFVEVNEDATNIGNRYSIISLLFGWTSLFGPIHTIRCIVNNFRGGRDITEEVADWLENLQKVV